MNNLPEKWCIEVTLKNKKVLEKWRSSGSITNKDYGFCYYPNYQSGHVGYYKETKDSYVDLITFNDFERLVLKKSITKSLFKL